jgi:hypothetical protein
MVSQSQAQDISGINDSGGGDDSGAYFDGGERPGDTYDSDESKECGTGVSGSPIIAGTMHFGGGTFGRSRYAFDGGLDHDVVLAGDEFGGNVANLGFTHKANEGAASWSYS